MTFWEALARHLAEAATWTGRDGLLPRAVEHLWISGAALLVAAVLALPLAVWLGHTGRGGVLAVNLSNVGRAVPTFALLVLALQVLGFGLKPVLVALVALAVPPLITNTYVGMRQVDADVREAAKGMGMRGREVLRSVELPLAVPYVLGGMRTAAVQVVATATLAAVIGSGGLGRIIETGRATRNEVLLVTGAAAVAVLALATEVGLGQLQRRCTPRGLRSRAATAPATGAATDQGDAHP